MHIILVHFMIHVNRAFVVDAMIANHVYGSMENVHYRSIHQNLTVDVRHRLLMLVFIQVCIDLFSLRIF